MTTNTVFQLRRNAVSGTRPTTTTVAPGELAINTTDGILFSANSTSIFEIGANLTSITVGNVFIANSSVTRSAASLLVPGTSGEGGQIVLGYGNNLANTITGQANNTFNIDVIGGNTGFTPQFRIFTQNGDGSTTAILNAANTGRVHIGSVAEQTDSTFKVTGTANVTGNAAVGGALSSANLTTTTNTATFGTAAYVVANGNIGIGTASPGSRLHIVGSEVRLQTTDAFYSIANTTGGRYGYFRGVGSGLQIVAEAAAANIIYLQTTATPDVALIANGNLGIGNTSPSHRLRVQGDISVSGGIHANGSLGTAGQVLSSNGTGVYWDTGVTASSTATLTNKRIDPRVSTTASATTVTPDIGSFDMYIYTALAAGLTINASTTGSPVNGSKLMFRFKDNGTARGLTWTTSGTGAFRAVGVTLPSTTVINKVTYVGCIYNATESFWDVVAVLTQA